MLRVKKADVMNRVHQHIFAIARTTSRVEAVFPLRLLNLLQVT